MKYTIKNRRGFAGGCPAATHFLCFAKESKQRKATPGSSPRKSAGFPALLTNAGRCGTRARRRFCAARCSFRSPSNSPRGNLPRLLRCSATLMGTPVVRNCVVKRGRSGIIYRKSTWIPAFAGMTKTKILSFRYSGMTKSFARSLPFDRVPMRVAEQRRNDWGVPRGLFEAGQR